MSNSVNKNIAIHCSWVEAQPAIPGKSERGNVSNLYSILQRTGAVAATHSGSFHADDVLAAATLRLVKPALTILRSRDQDQLNAADILFDVGRVFDPATCRFDHHQLEYKEARENGIPYSSFGLVWRELGRNSVSSSRRGEQGRSLAGARRGCHGLRHYAKQGNLARHVDVDFRGAWSFNPGWQDVTSTEARNEAFEHAISLAKAILQNTIRDANGFEKARAAVVEQGFCWKPGGCWCWSTTCRGRIPCWDRLSTSTFCT